MLFWGTRTCWSSRWFPFTATMDKPAIGICKGLCHILDAQLWITAERLKKQSRFYQHGYKGYQRLCCPPYFPIGTQPPKTVVCLHALSLNIHKHTIPTKPVEPPTQMALLDISPRPIRCNTDEVSGAGQDEQEEEQGGRRHQQPWCFWFSFSDRKSR